MNKNTKLILMSGNEALAEGAIQAGCRFYAGYPITPQNEIPAYMATRMPEVGGVFIQAESEIAAINMVFGASAAGARALTSSSSPGISLKQEGISYLAGAKLPAVIVNIMRGGPGLGNIAAAQSDYFQATRSGGHGDYHLIVYAPYCVQEMYDLTAHAFDVSDAYRVPAMILGDGILGQMMEPFEKKVIKPRFVKKPWALVGAGIRKGKSVKSFFMQDGDLEKHNLELQSMYSHIRSSQQKWESFLVDDAKAIVVAYGTMARIARSVVNKLRAKGKKVGLIRPITLWPFPFDAFKGFKHGPRKKFVVTEMSYGQMVEDVSLALYARHSISFVGRAAGGIPSEESIAKQLECS